MHCVVESPGFRFDRVNRAFPASSSDNATVPAANALPGFVVVAVNAAFVADSTRAPQAPTATSAISPFCRRRNHLPRRERRVPSDTRRPTPPPPPRTPHPFGRDAATMRPGQEEWRSLSRRGGVLVIVDESG